MWKIIQPWGWSGTPHELFDVIDPYAVKHREFRKMAKARSVHPDVDAFVERELPSMKSSRYLYILTSNMGADETWGSNVNSDSFERKALAYKGSDWGIETFKTAGIFKDHKNTDKAKSYGDIVFVTFASAEDGYMDRVESIVRLDRERASKVGASDVIHSIEHGNYPAWSMGCFKKGTLITFPDGGMKPIEEVKEGDFVVTHKGRPRRVAKTIRYRYEGCGVSIKAAGQPPVECTEEHPFLVLRSSKTEWVRADQLRERDVLLLPLVETNAAAHETPWSEEKLQQQNVHIDGVDYVSTPIQTLHKIRVEEDVFNFEVEEDNSYIAERFAVHNCRVAYDVCSFCGNQAPNRAAYCVHMKRYPNAVLTETFRGKPGFESMKDQHLGLRIRVFNPKPKFFDFSKVVIGAAAEAKTLQKLASQHHLLLSSDLAALVYGDAMKLAEEKQSALRKRSDIDKRIEPQQDAPIGTTLKVLSDHEPQLEEPLLNALESAPFAQGLSSLAGCGMMLKPPEFQRLALGGLGFPSLGKELWDNNFCFDPHTECNPEPCPPIRMDLFLRGLAQLFLSLVPQRSVFHPPLVKRMMVIRIRPSSKENGGMQSVLNSLVGEEKTSSVRSFSHPTLTKIAGMYKSYKYAFAEFLHDNGVHMLSLYPEIRDAVCSSLPLTLSKEASPLLSALTFHYIVSV